ncbi:NADH dehydrogenase [ubiquinone] iron-sulfur protein 7, mitochondrial [Glycine soja]
MTFGLACCTTKMTHTNAACYDLDCFDIIFRPSPHQFDRHQRSHQQDGFHSSQNLWVFLARIQTIMACRSIRGKSGMSEGGANDSVASVGDVIFVKLHGSSWWVVDDNSVNKSVKSSKRTKQLQGDILVRHYGSYT